MSALILPSSGLAQTDSAKFETGSYVGKTRQGLPIALTVSRTAVLSLEFRWRAKCADGRVHVNTISLGSGRINHGSFSLGGTLNTGGKAHVQGKLRGKHAWGRLSRWKSSAFGTNCVARGIRWRAHLSSDSPGDPTGPSTTYTGATSQGLPIFFTASATEILSLRFGWSADCADGQTHANTISAGSGPIYNDVFALGGVLDTGGHFQVDGTITGATASGTLSRGGASAFGTFDCNISGVTWQAQAVG
ncbi:MAG TPA: hypothetical protein VF176_04305 [Solirubrobacterales bacterium]